ncbi:MAG TPA: hypothetical protein VJL54_08725 [Nitrososphaera sp.]|nr:hypothetical protein [Nitrososphaera sp.]
MARTSRPAVKTLTINRSRDIVVERLVEKCADGNHGRCTGWAVLRKEHSPINANYFIKCTCQCHRKGHRVAKKKVFKVRRKVIRRKEVAKKTRKAKRSRRR